MSKADYKKGYMCERHKVAPLPLAEGGLGMVQSSRGGQEPIGGPSQGVQVRSWAGDKFLPCFQPH